MRKLLIILIVLVAAGCGEENLRVQKSDKTQILEDNTKSIDVEENYGNPYYFNPIDDEFDSNYVKYWCSIDILVETEKNINKLDISKVANFMATFHQSCKDNVEFNEWSNEILFKVLNNNPQEFLNILEKNNSLRRNCILHELSNPIHDIINLDSLSVKVNKLESHISDDWKLKILESLEEAKNKIK